MPDWILANAGRPVALNQLNQVAEELIKEGKAFSVWLLDGAMGSGKTTLVKALAAHLGIKDVVASPTFSLVNEYTLPDGRPTYHFDFYRMKNEMEAYDIGADEYLDSGNYCWLEWFEKIPSLLPQHYFHVKIETTDFDHRLISFAKYE